VETTDSCFQAGCQDSEPFLTEPQAIVEGDGASVALHQLQGLELPTQFQIDRRV